MENREKKRRSEVEKAAKPALRCRKSGVERKIWQGCGKKAKHGENQKKMSKKADFSTGSFPCGEKNETEKIQKNENREKSESKGRVFGKKYTANP